MEQSREEFLHRCNVENYTRLLLTSPDATRRAVLTVLLVEESQRAKANGWAPVLN